MDTYSKASPLKVLMFPWLAYGHISPFLGLAKILADRGCFSIYLCSTPINLQSIQKSIPQNYFHSINLVEFHLESTPEFPPHFHTTNGLPPHLQPTLRKAVHKAKPNISKIFDRIKPDLLIYDINQSWVVGFSYRLNIPAVKFTTSGAAMLSYFCHMGQKPGNPFPFMEIHLTNFEHAKANESIESAKKDHDEEFEAHEMELTKRACDIILLLKSSREIEGKYIDYLSDLVGWKCFPFCSFSDESLDNDDDDDDDEHELISWLGMKKERSSVFVSFGSEYFLKKQELEEIAYGLEISQVNFIWVLRFPKGEGEKNSVEEALPEGFLNRVGDRGRIVYGWAPQKMILRHSSISGFISHCGWNSIFEAIKFGVPMIAMPMHLDQPFNARLVVEIGAGIEVNRDNDGKLDRKEIARVIKEVVGGGTAASGGEVRWKVQGLGQKLKAKEKEDLDGLVQMLKMLCNDK